MKRNSVNTMLRISLFSALIAVSAMISIPFPVPVTLQTFTVFLALFTLGGIRASAAVLVYTALGVVGLPVFAGFNSGIGYILGASGGFVLAFPLAAILFAVLEIFIGSSEKKKLCYSALAMLLIYVIGSLWFALVYSGEESFAAALLVCALPFIPIDAVKLALAYVISKRLKKLIAFSN